MNGAGIVAGMVLAGVTLALFGALLRLFSGATLFDRLLAANGIAIKSVFALAALALVFAQSQWIDAAFALLFALIVSNVAIVKFFRVHSFQPPLGAKREGSR